MKVLAPYRHPGEHRDPVRPVGEFPLPAGQQAVGVSCTALTPATALAEARPGLDGLWANSTMAGQPNVVLWTPAADAFPAAPVFSRPLADPNLRAVVALIAASDLNTASFEHGQASPSLLAGGTDRATPFRVPREAERPGGPFFRPLAT